MSRTVRLSSILRSDYTSRGPVPYTRDDVASAADCIPRVAALLGRGTVSEAVAAIASVQASPAVRDLLCEVFDVPPLSSLALA